MSQQEGILAAIQEAPDDDTPRLVYADWLAEHGDPERAEFIRVQCELARHVVVQQDARHLEATAGPQHSERLGQDARLVGAQVEADHRTGRHMPSHGGP
jgi:uncharacterized protein (TIGR02996 family)